MKVTFAEDAINRNRVRLAKYLVEKIRAWIQLFQRKGAHRLHPIPIKRWILSALGKKLRRSEFLTVCILLS